MMHTHFKLVHGLSKNLPLLVSLMLMLIVLGGCGNKGDLVLPEPQSVPTPSEPENQEEKDG